MSITEYIYTVVLNPKPLRKLANRILLSLLPKSVQVKGATVFLNPSDPVISAAVLFGVYESWEIDFFHQNFRPGMTFIDVGANVGLYTALALKAASSSSKILCVEPHNESRSYLEKTIYANLHAHEHANVILCSVAAGDKMGYAKLYQNAENKGDNRLAANDLCSDSVDVEINTIDALCAKNGISSVDFLKIDVQGYEGKVLHGASGILSNSKKCIVMLEFWPFGLMQVGTSPIDFLAHLNFMDIKLYRPCNGKFLPVNNLNDLIHENPGRVYSNLVGLKGMSEVDLIIP